MQRSPRSIDRDTLLKALKHKCKYVMLEVFGGKAPLGEYVKRMQRLEDMHMNCRTAVGTVGQLLELSDSCRTVERTGDMEDRAGAWYGRVYCRDDCRTLSDTVGLSDCRTVGLSDDCRMTVG
eukprot:748159-Prymnesium_polylepis.2